MNIVLIYFAIKYNGDWDMIYQALSEKEKIEHSELINLENNLKKEDFKCVTIIDQNYPKELKDCYKPPFVLWLKGNLDLLQEKKLILTGNDYDDNIKIRIKNFSSEAFKNHVLITGSFKGVDELVLKESSKTIFVLAKGLNYLESDKLNSNDLYITEYPLNTKPNKKHFKNRNRIIASFSKSLVLFSSKKNGGINNLVINFLNMGKEIYCFPGNGDENDGNSELVKQGANLITSIKDIS